MKTFKDYEDRWQQLDFSKLTLKKIHTDELIPKSKLSIIVKHQIDKKAPASTQLKQATKEDDAKQES